MADLICRKTMLPCQTPGTCSPHGGCRTSLLKETDVRYSASSSPANDPALNPKILAFLAALRDVHPDMARWGLNGGCFKVHLLLKQAFPDAEPWYDSDHVITKIGDHFYDIRGQVEPVSSVGAEYLRMDPLCFNRAYGWDQPALTTGREVSHG